MVEDDTTTSPTPPPPPDAGLPGDRRELRRSRDNRVVAGVAAGLGRYFGIDPVIVRIGFIVLAVFGGSGVLLYLVAWLVIAKEGEDDSAAGRVLKGSDQPRGRGVIAVLLIVAAVFILGGPVLWFADFGFGDGLFFPLLLVAAGVALLLWPNDEGWSALRPRNQPDTRPATTVTGDLTATTSASTDRDTTAAMSSASTDLVPLANGLAEIDSDIDSDIDSEPPSGFPPAPPTADAEDEGPEEPEAPRRRTFPVTSITFAVLLVMTGVAALLDRFDAVEVRPVAYLATALVIIGIGLVAAAFVGRVWGLVVLGLLILPVLWFATVVDIDWWSGVGEERIVVDDPDDLADTYHHGIGHLIVDLRGLDLAGETTDLEIGLSIGQIEVLVPPDLEVDVDADGQIGQLVVQQSGRDQVDDGFDTSIDTTIPGDDGRLNLDLDIGIGEARVEVGV